MAGCGWWGPVGSMCSIQGESWLLFLFLPCSDSCLLWREQLHHTLSMVSWDIKNHKVIILISCSLKSLGHTVSVPRERSSTRSPLAGSSPFDLLSLKATSTVITQVKTFLWPLNTSLSLGIVVGNSYDIIIILGCFLGLFSYSLPWKEQGHPLWGSLYLSAYKCVITFVMITIN